MFEIIFTLASAAIIIAFLLWILYRFHVNAKKNKDLQYRPIPKVGERASAARHSERSWAAEASARKKERNRR